MKGNLYIVATPIGNLEDITLRAINVLKSVDLIIAEDTRHSLKLLNHLEITKPLISYHRHNEEDKTENILKKIEEGKNIALISEAGTPVISDPGEFIVKEAIEREINVVSIPGACAIITQPDILQPVSLHNLQISALPDGFSIILQSLLLLHYSQSAMNSFQNQ